MKEKEKLYTQWLTHRRQIKVPENFSIDLMAAIDMPAAEKRGVLDSDILLRVHHPLAKWAAALGLVLIGLFRIFFVAGNLLRASSVMP